MGSVGSTIKKKFGKLFKQKEKEVGDNVRKDLDEVLKPEAVYSEYMPELVEKIQNRRKSTIADFKNGGMNDKQASLATGKVYKELGVSIRKEYGSVLSDEHFKAISALFDEEYNFEPIPVNDGNVLYSAKRQEPKFPSMIQSQTSISDVEVEDDEDYDVLDKDFKEKVKTAGGPMQIGKEFDRPKGCIEAVGPFVPNDFDKARKIGRFTNKQGRKIDSDHYTNAAKIIDSAIKVREGGKFNNKGYRYWIQLSDEQQVAKFVVYVVDNELSLCDKFEFPVSDEIFYGTLPEGGKDIFGAKGVTGPFSMDLFEIRYNKAFNGKQKELNYLKMAKVILESLFESDKEILKYDNSNHSLIIRYNQDETLTIYFVLAKKASCVVYKVKTAPIS